MQLKWLCRMTLCEVFLLCSLFLCTGPYLVMEGKPVLEPDAILLMQLRELKTLYRQRHKVVRDMKAEVNYCQHLVDQCRVRLLSGQLSKYHVPSVFLTYVPDETTCCLLVPEFEDWYEKCLLAPEEDLDVSPGRVVREVSSPSVYNRSTWATSNGEESLFQCLRCTLLPCWAQEKKVGRRLLPDNHSSRSSHKTPTGVSFTFRFTSKEQLIHYRTPHQLSLDRKTTVSCYLNCFVSTEDWCWALLCHRGTHAVKEDFLKLKLWPKVSFIYSLICFELVSVEMEDFWMSTLYLRQSAQNDNTMNQLLKWKVKFIIPEPQNRLLWLYKFTSYSLVWALTPDLFPPAYLQVKAPKE